MTISPFEKYTNSTYHKSSSTYLNPQLSLETVYYVSQKFLRILVIIITNLLLLKVALISSKYIKQV